MTSSRRVNLKREEALNKQRDCAIRLFSQNLPDDGSREDVAEYIDQTISRYGPIVDSYPSWHPFTTKRIGVKHPQMAAPTGSPRIEALDHTVFFRDALITVPHSRPHAQIIIDSALARGGIVSAHEIENVQLYTTNAHPVLVWVDIPKEIGGTITTRFALASMLLEEVSDWEFGPRERLWHDRKEHILGSPCSGCSSAFINQSTGRILRGVWNTLKRHELFGSLY